MDEMFGPVVGPLATCMECGAAVPRETSGTHEAWHRSLKNYLAREYERAHAAP